MPDVQEKVCLIVPCYNERERLDLSLFRSYGFIHYLFVNDGSSDGTLELLKQQVGDGDYYLDLPQNCGKAEAVRRGMLHLKELPIYEQLSWVGFWDADLATPVEEVDFFLKFAALYDNVDAIYGSRIDRLGGEINRNYFRHVLGRVFATAIQSILKLGTYDSQCGAKLFRKELIGAAFSEPFISRWLFDLEILMRLDGFTVIECPLRRWIEVGGSKIRFLPFLIRAARDIWKMYFKYRR